MPNGFHGKILRVHLSHGKTSIEEHEEDFYRRYFGGTALISYYLLKEQKAKIDPLGPENKLIFAPGVVTGAPLGGSGRNAIGSKSPLTNGFSSTEVGGYWGAELKHAGYDAIVIEGKADKPVYLWIQDGKVEIKDATHLWGKTTAETQELMRKELGDSGVRTALIGPGGENLVRFACIVNDLGHCAGRNGMGAVMGSKNLKGIAVRGHNPPSIADPEAISKMAKWLLDNIKIHPFLTEFSEVGTLSGALGYNQRGGLVTNNFQEGFIDGAEKLDFQYYMDNIGAGRYTCYACPVRCKHQIKVGEPYNIEPEPYHHGPEYEGALALGSCCGTTDLEAIAMANELCSAYSIDVISCGVTIAFAMECVQRGILTEKDTDGIQLTFGNAEAMLKMVEMICRREGIGAILAEGCARAAQEIGKGSEEYAMHAKGLELPMHGPHLKPVTGLGYALCPTGADHGRNIAFPQGLEAPGPVLDQLKPLGILDTLPLSDFSSPARIRSYIYWTNWLNVVDSLSMCSFCAFGYQQARVGDIVRGVTGWDTTTWELMKVGERAMNMMRAFNVREGFTREDDSIPKRFHEPFQSAGPLKGTKLDKAEFEKAKDTYYNMMGWDNNGVPQRAKLQELDIEWVADELKK